MLVNGVVTDAAQFIHDPIDTIGKLAAVASKYPYYKYNGMWTKEVQKTVCIDELYYRELRLTVVKCELILFTGWLGGRFPAVAEHDQGKLFTIDDLGEILQIPVNLKDRDAFHLTIEEYLHALISLIDELARLAVNSVTLGDFNKPPQISQFVKDIHAGFQILNLKNDSLRRRSDSIKYNVSELVAFLAHAHASDR